MYLDCLRILQPYDYLGALQMPNSYCFGLQIRNIILKQSQTALHGELKNH